MGVSANVKHHSPRGSHEAPNRLVTRWVTVAATPRVAPDQSLRCRGDGRAAPPPGPSEPHRASAQAFCRLSDAPVRRIAKCGISRYNIWNRDGRPRDSSPITAIEITVHPPALPSAKDPSRALSGRWSQVCQLLAANSNQAMHTRTSPGISGFPPRGAPQQLHRATLYWARNGQLIRTAPNTYKIALPDALTPPLGS